MILGQLGGKIDACVTYWSAKLEEVAVISLDSHEGVNTIQGCLGSRGQEDEA